MNTDLETQLSADMARFTLGIRVPPDLARQACRRNRRRRATLRAAIASGTTAALIVAVAVAGVAGVFTSTARLPILTTAYVVKQIDKALAPANVATLIGVTRAGPVPGHKPGELISPSALLGPACTGSTMLSWTYGETWKLSAYDADGRHLYDLRTSATRSSVQETRGDLLQPHVVGRHQAEGRTAGAVPASTGPPRFVPRCPRASTA